MKHNHAFTLVELSIVLVILGLLTGGILTGQSLIRAAELRSIITERDRYAAAIQTFRDKYRGLPGDITNATAFWGDGPDAPLACDVPAGAAAHYDICNGNGNGQVGYLSTTSWTATEMIQLWSHLAAAGLIEGSYSGQHDLVYRIVTSAPVTTTAARCFLQDRDHRPLWSDAGHPASHRPLRGVPRCPLKPLPPLAPADHAKASAAHGRRPSPD